MSELEKVEHPEARWSEFKCEVPNLKLDAEHELPIRREAIPLIFVPGLMGSRLRLSGTDGQGDTEGLPNMRWDPDSKTFNVWNYIGRGPLRRKNMLVGQAFSENFLEVHNTNPVGNGFQGIMADYHAFLRHLMNYDWGALGKIFLFPVYAVGYNWTDSNANSGRRLKGRISEIIAEAREITGLCSKAIVITHSMGGLVARSAIAQGAGADLLGVVHGVQPAFGAPAAYWRMKAGFEGGGLFAPLQRALGFNGRDVTAVLGNIPGGLQLLPNHLFRTNAGEVPWLRIMEGKSIVRQLPASNSSACNPYKDIYSVPAEPRPAKGKGPTTNIYWGLVDPALLDPGNAATAATAPRPAPGDNNSLDDAAPETDPWGQFLSMLDDVEKFHRSLGSEVHPQTFSFHGTDHRTAEVVELRIESRWDLLGPGDPYENQGFRGYFRNASGDLMQAVLQRPVLQRSAGDGDEDRKMKERGYGDGTVPLSSARALNKKGEAESKIHPGDQHFPVEHQPAFNDAAVQAYVVRAILALCKQHYNAGRTA